MKKAVFFILLILCVQLCTGFLSWIKDLKKEKKEKEKVVYVYPQEAPKSYSGGCGGGYGKGGGGSYGGCGGGRKGGYGGGRKGGYGGGRGGGGRCG